MSTCVAQRDVIIVGGAMTQPTAAIRARHWLSPAVTHGGVIDIARLRQRFMHGTEAETWASRFCCNFSYGKLTDIQFKAKVDNH